VLLAAATLVLLRPDLIRDQFTPPFELQPPARIAEVLKTVRPGENIRLRVEVDDKKGRVQERTFLLPMEKGTKPEQAIRAAGVVMEEKDGKTIITDVAFDSAAEKVGLGVTDNNRVLGVETKLPQADKEWFTSPGWLLIVLVFGLQWKRRLFAGKRAGLNNE
jgi:hypothetical protein